MARGISLHLGLNAVDPAHYDGWDGTLGACEFDADAMESIAKSRGFETTKLLTRQVTAESVKAAIESAAERARSGRLLLRHVLRVTEVRSRTRTPTRRIDKTDETWVLYDRQLVDDELYALVGEVQAGSADLPGLRQLP